MSRARLSWLFATVRLRGERLMRDVRVRTRRHPVASPIVPRPPRRARGARAMRLSHVLVATDLNACYLECWPLARRAWSAIAGLEPILVLIARPSETPHDLRSDPNVHVFEPVEGVHTAFQAQCIRLLYPSLLETDGAVLTSDVDMLPLNRQYFHRPAARIYERHFLAYRDVLMQLNEIPICYNAALPGIWADIFGVGSHADIRSRLTEWGTTDYDGVRGGRGWERDQVILHRTLVDRARRNRDVWILDDAYTGHCRLDRDALAARGTLDSIERRGIGRGVYTDFHCLLPHSEYRELNELAVDLAASGG